MYSLRKKINPETAEKLMNKKLEELIACPDHSLTLEFDAWTSSTGQGVLALVLTTLNGNSTRESSSQENIIMGR